MFKSITLLLLLASTATAEIITIRGNEGRQTSAIHSVTPWDRNVDSTLTIEYLGDRVRVLDLTMESTQLRASTKPSTWFDLDPRYESLRIDGVEWEYLEIFDVVTFQDPPSFPLSFLVDYGLEGMEIRKTWSGLLIDRNNPILRDGWIVNEDETIRTPNWLYYVDDQPVDKISLNYEFPDGQNSRLQVGDANMDGSFNSEDLIEAFSYHTYERPGPTGVGWRQGDWNHDDLFTTDDLLLAMSLGHYDMGATATASVPEPTSWLLIVIGMFCHKKTRLGATRRQSETGPTGQVQRI